MPSVLNRWMDRQTSELERRGTREIYVGVAIWTPVVLAWVAVAVIADSGWIWMGMLSCAVLAVPVLLLPRLIVALRR